MFPCLRRQRQYAIQFRRSGRPWPRLQPPRSTGAIHRWQRLEPDPAAAHRPPVHLARRSPRPQPVAHAILARRRACARHRRTTPPERLSAPAAYPPRPGARPMVPPGSEYPPSRLAPDRSGRSRTDRFFRSLQPRFRRTREPFRSARRAEAPRPLQDPCGRQAAGHRYSPAPQVLALPSYDPHVHRFGQRLFSPWAAAWVRSSRIENACAGGPYAQRPRLLSPPDPGPKRLEMQFAVQRQIRFHHQDGHSLRRPSAATSPRLVRWIASRSRPAGRPRSSWHSRSRRRRRALCRSGWSLRPARNGPRNSIPPAPGPHVPWTGKPASTEPCSHPASTVSESCNPRFLRLFRNLGAPELLNIYRRKGACGKTDRWRELCKQS
ncbi:hypothetical protein SAMN04515678_102203 [Roseivivax sediminis]|uniref:Uncharacterized protein n=1 Tax=Roseivivax sediminis TaxID=936889 RepID=A0A1I1UDU1_9RHOB|nr:hypothetical protein SAMN04515678_102203 [Roseivivax sediminis]